MAEIGSNLLTADNPSDLEQLKFLFIDLMTVYDKYVRNYTRNPY